MSRLQQFSGYGPSLIVLITAVAILFGGPSIIRQLNYVQTETRVIQASDRLAGNDILEQLNQATRDVATIVEPSVVHISAVSYDGRDRFGGQRAPSDFTGSGWVYDEDGHVITNHHVVKDAEQIEVQLWSGDLRRAELIGADPDTDIAVLKINPGRLHPARRAEVDTPLQQGDRVFAFGSPFDFRFSMSSGIISGLGRSGGSSLGIRHQDFIQVDAAINPGNSGGPLTDVHGRVIGMNTAIATNQPNHSSEGHFSGIGLAIPISMIEPTVSQIVETGTVTKSFLGVTIEELERSTNRFSTLEYQGHGVVVTQVRPDSPASHADIKVRDIITHVDGQLVSSTQQLTARIASRRPGERVELTIWRARADDEPVRKVEVELDEFDMLVRLQRYGITKVETATSERAEAFNVEHHEGAIILESDHEARLGPGTIITHVDNERVTTVEELRAELSERNNIQKAVILRLILPDGSEISRPLLF